MLALTRKDGQSIVLTLPNNETIIVTVASAKFGSARLAIDAPKHIGIVRQELYVEGFRKQPQPKETV